MITDNEEKPVTRVFHERECGTGIHAMLQPVGVSYNGDIQALTKGDRISFWGEDEGVVVDVCEVPMRLPIFQVLCKWIYGESTPRSKIIERWKDHAVMMGNGVDAVSTKKCLLIRYTNK